MTDTETLRRRLDEIHWEMRGEVRLAAMEEHLAAVEASGDQPLLNAALNALVDCYEFSPDSTRLLVPYARMLHNLDTAPEHFDARLLRSVFWQLKWVVFKLIEHPDVPRESIEEWLGQMHGRYSEAGHSLHPYHAAEYWAAHHFGDDERAAAAAARLAECEPDGMSDCEACRIDDTGQIAANGGDLGGALEAWRPILRDGMSCAHQPHYTLACSLLPLAALGRLDEARANHLHGYRIARGRDDMLPYVARHIRFCALTGNEARAIELLAADRRAYGFALNPDARLTWLEGVQVAAGALGARGLGSTALPGPEERDWTADDLHAWADAERRALCERYDRRNGNGVHSRRSRERVEPGTAYPHVPLGLRAMPEAKRSAPEPERVAPTAEALEAALAAAREAVASADEDRVERWAEAARLASALGVELEPLDRAEAVLAEADPDADPEAAQELAGRAADLFAAAGSPGRALLCRVAKAGWGMRVDPLTLQAAAPVLLAEADAVTAADPVSAARSRAQIRMAQLQSGLMLGERPGPGLAEAFAASDAELAALQGNRRAEHVRVHLVMMAAEFETGTDERIAALRRAYELTFDGGFRYETFIAAFQYGSILNQTGNLEAALAVAKTGIAASRPADHALPLAAMHLTAAEAAFNLGDAAAAESYAVRAAHWYDRAGETGCAGVARHLLGSALAALDRYDESAVILDAALADLPEMADDEHWRLADARYLLADGHRRLGDAQAGLVHALEALRLMDGGLIHPDPTVYARCAHLAGQLLERTGEPESAVDAYRRSERAWRLLGALPAAANPIRAAIWAGLTDEPDTAAAAMHALAAELETDWHDGSLHPDYREACRAALADTLLQRSRLQTEHAVETEDHWAHRTVREAAALLAVAEDGDYLADQAISMTHNLIAAHEHLDDLESAEAAAARAIAHLGPEAPAARSLRHHLDAVRSNAANEE